VTSRDGLPRSVLTRLARHAREVGADPNLVFTRYALERLLYRLSQSAHADRFILKGGLLLLAWLGETFRPTRDLDLLGYGDLSDDSLIRIFSDVCTVEVVPDGMTYLGQSVRAGPIRATDEYGGRRVAIEALCGAARAKVQVDVGLGDVVSPAPVRLEYPALLEFPAPLLRSYTPESVIAEKLHALVDLGLRNSRMKDYFDLQALLSEGERNDGRLAAAVAATFAARRTDLPEDVPDGLSDEFARDPAKQAQWNSFLERGDLTAPRLEQVVADVWRYLEKPLQRARQRDAPP
jgi:predicted nucleotidyltransferase component of viral defense system